MSIAEATVFNVHTDLAVINCGVCAGVYAISERYRKDRQFKGEGWTCPYCQAQWGYFSDSDRKKLEREIERQKKYVEWEANARKQTQKERDAALHRERAQKAAKTRLKNRIAAGVCPCCKRTFQNLARHMKTKHPGYGGKHEQAD